MTPYNPWWRKFFTREGRLQWKLLRLSNKIMWIDGAAEREPYIIQMDAIRQKIRKLQDKR
jgi:hypothetical protein